MSKALTLDLTECSICTEVFKNPKCLPCIHTFCLDCIQQYAKNYTTEKLPCPICRQEFKIPENGLEKLPRNFFIERLMEATVQQDENSQKSQERLCDLCSELGEGQAALVTFYCVDCDQYLCHSCKIRHEKQRATKSHSLCSLEEQKSRMKILKSSPTFCSKHDDKKLELFCHNCKELVCLMCFAIGHHGHECVDLKTSAKNFGNKLNENGLILEKESIRLGDIIKKIDEDQRKIEHDSITTERAIEDHFKRMIDFLEEEKRNLIGKLHEQKKADEKVLNVRKEEIETVRCEYMRLVDYSRRLCDEGTYCDISATAPSLLERLQINSTVTIEDKIEPSRALVYQMDEEDRESKLRSLLGTLQPKDAVFVEQKKIIPLNNDLMKQMKAAQVQCSYTSTPYLAIFGFTNLKNNYHIRDVACYVNLAKKDSVVNFYSHPVIITPHGTGCVMQNDLYTFISSNTGTLVVNKCGLSNNRWNSFDLNTFLGHAYITPGRTRHSAVVIGETIYIIGGNPRNNSDESDIDVILSRIQSYNTKTGCIEQVGFLKCGVYDAGCLEYNNKIYVFGGTVKDEEDVSHIQVFDPRFRKCDIFKNLLPEAASDLKPVLYKDKAILLGQDTVFVYDFITRKCVDRSSLAVDDHYFGVALYDDKIFIAGGGKKINDDRRKYSRVVNYMPVADILVGADDARWEYHATLPEGGYVHVFGQIEHGQFL